MRTDRTDGLVVRNMLLQGRARARLLHRGDRRRAPRQGQVLLERRLRPPELHDRPQRHPELRGDGGRRRGRLPRRVAADGRVPQRGVLSRAPATTRSSAGATCTARRSAYSGSMGNSVRITENHIYGNTAGIVERHAVGPRPSRAIPADGMQIDNNLIYSNNLDLYGTNPPVTPLVPDADRHRRDLAGDERRARSSATGSSTTGATARCSRRCPTRWRASPRATSTRRCTAPTRPSRPPRAATVFEENVMGRVPPGFTWPTAIGKFGNQHGSRTATRAAERRGLLVGRVPGNNGNCWVGNKGVDGTPGSVTGSGAGMPPDPLPSDCEGSVGTGDVVKEGVLADCVTWYDFHGDGAYPLCYWFRMPEQPGSPEARRDQRAWAADRPRVRGQPRRPGPEPEAPRLRRGVRVLAAPWLDDAPSRPPRARRRGADRLRRRRRGPAEGRAARREAGRLGRAARRAAATGTAVRATASSRRSPTSATRSTATTPASSRRRCRTPRRCSCSTASARSRTPQGFRLYVIYARAAGFAPLVRE